MENQEETSREKEISVVFDLLKEMMKKHQGSKVTWKGVYNSLESYGLSKEERENIVRYDGDVYHNLFTKYKNSNFDIISQGNFIHFCNWGNFNESTLKLYLSPKPEKAQVTMEKILDYISEKDIKTDAKIAHHDRSDSIVLRITSIEDTKRVVEFINSDSEIAKNARKTNPFIVREGVVGIAFDDELSYNSIVSNLIAIYLNEKTFYKDVDSVSLQDFKKFISDYFENTFVSGINTNKYLSDFEKDYDENRHKMRPVDLMLNHMHVINMIGNAISQKDSFEVVESIFKLSINNEFNNSYKKDFEKLLYNTQTKKTL